MRHPASPEIAREECPTFDTAEIPVNQTLELKITGTLDSSHLKPGQKIYAEVMHGLIYPECTLNMKSIVYGHITAVSANRNPDNAELGIVFDRGDCVVIRTRAGIEAGRGLSAYASGDIRQIAGHKSGEIATILGYRGRDEIIHRDDLVLTEAR